MPVTVANIVDGVITELSQVPGVSTQIYATPRITKYVEDAFDLCFQRKWWDAYTSFWTGTLDGTTGHLTADIVPTTPKNSLPISSHTNIRNCFPAGTTRRIKQLPPNTNPSVYGGSSGSEPIYRATDYTFENRPIKFYPLNATGDIDIEVRQEPLHPFGSNDVLYLDRMMLVLGACYMYAADDGTNPGQINKFQSLFLKRLSDMVAAENDTPLQLDPRLDHHGFGSNSGANPSDGSDGLFGSDGFTLLGGDGDTLLP